MCSKFGIYLNKIDISNAVDKISVENGQINIIPLSRLFYPFFLYLFLNLLISNIFGTYLHLLNYHQEVTTELKITTIHRENVYSVF